MRYSAISRVVYQPDILEWATTNKSAFESMRTARAATKGTLSSIKSLFGSTDKSTTESTEIKESTTEKAEEPKLGENLMQQYYQSQELRNVLKWKRISWDTGADYEGFSSRLLEASKMLSKKRAFSFLGVHIVKDEARVRVNNQLNIVDEPSAPLALHEITQGSLTSWYTSLPAEQEKAETSTEKPTKYHRPAPFSLSWETGQVKMLDSISLDEMLYFLENFALRAQQTQLRIEEEQTNLNEAVENVRFRCTLDALKFNEEDQALVTDTSKDTLKPAQVMQFCTSMLKTAWLYRKYFRGQRIRIGLPGTSYSVSQDKGEVTIPCDFDKFSWMDQHQKFLRHEAIANSYRNHWYVWLFAATVIIGDLDFV